MVCFSFGVAKTWFQTPSGPIPSPVKEEASKPIEKASTKSKNRLLNTRPQSSSTKSVTGPKQINSPAKSSSPSYPRGAITKNSPIHANPYIDMMKKVSANRIQQGKSAPHPLDSKNPHPYLHPSQVDKLSKSLDSINSGEIKEKQLQKRNLYFEKLSQQLEELQNKGGGRAGAAFGQPVSEIGKSAENVGTNNPSDSNEEGSEEDEEFEEEFLDDEFVDEEPLEDFPVDENGQELPVLDEGLEFDPEFEEPNF